MSGGCEKCGAERTAEAAFCHQCGAPRARGATAAHPAAPVTARAPAGSGSTPIFPLLARANLLRMRGRWQEAAELCAEALRLDPGNATAHSLLGDVHENQGNLEEAIHWYDLALRLNAGSIADAAKKSRAQELLEARQRRAEWTATIQGQSASIGARALLRESFQRVVAVVGAAVCAFILVTAVLISARVRPAGLGVDQPISHPQRRGPKETFPTSLTDREREVWRDLQREGWADSDFGQLIGLAISPRVSSAVLTFTPPDAALREPTLAARREGVLRSGYALAWAISRRDHALVTVEVRAVADAGHVGGRPGTRVGLFEGTLPAHNLVMDPTERSLTAADLSRAYLPDLWWHTGLQG